MELKCFGKINLFLDVLSKREDGYHEILSLYKSLPNMYDLMKIEFSNREIYFSNINIPWEKNSIKKAIDVFKKLTGYDFYLNVKLKKLIPIGSGFGGESADAACILRFLKEKFNISNKDIIEIASKVGADVAFLIFGGMAIGEGIGSNLTFLEDINLDIKTFFFNVKTSTREMYESIDRNWNKIFHKGDPWKLYEGLKERKKEIVKKNIFNIFEQVAFEKYPILESKKKELEKKYEYVLLSGSGGGFFSFNL